MSAVGWWREVCAISVLAVAAGHWGAPALSDYLSRPAGAPYVWYPNPEASPAASAPLGAATVPRTANPLSGKVLAGAVSSCTSLGRRAPIDLRSVDVKVGEVAGRSGTSAQVTMAYAGDVPTTGEVLWTLQAMNPAGTTIRLDSKVLDGQEANYGLAASADRNIPGEIHLVLPGVGLEMLGPVWWWSATVSVDGRVIDMCPDAW